MRPLPQIKQRPCGDCSACCTVLAVPTIEKGRYVKCQHLRPGNKCCGIYESRPGECGTYSCGWKIGLGSNAQRPDKFGVVFSMEDTVFGPTLLGLETRAGRGEAPEVVQLGLAVARAKNIALIMGGKDWRRVMHVPPGKEKIVAEYQKLLITLPQAIDKR